MYLFIKSVLHILIIFPFVLIACSGGEVIKKIDTQYKKINDVPESTWEKLSEKKIYFGHQSVGYNILEGVRKLISENEQFKLSIKETYDPDKFKNGTISHSQIGYNTNPKSKLEMFAFISKSGGAKAADIMFFKFCYVDINRNTDVDALFTLYKNTFDKLKSNYPQTVFIHLTTPLTTIQDGPKALLKKAIGRSLGGTIENRKRHEFNEKIRNAFLGKEPVFDIATIESTYSDGKRSAFELDGKTYYSLVPEYTNDGGHLNEIGAKKVAEQLLLAIVETL